MKTILLFFFLLISSFLFGQNVDSLRVTREVDSLVRIWSGLASKRQFSEALRSIEDAESFVATTIGIQNASYAQCIHAHALILQLQNKFEDAKVYYSNAVRIRREVLGPENLDYAQSLHNLSWVYKETGDYNKADSLLLIVIAIRGKILGKGHQDYLYSLSNLSDIYLDLGKYKEAESLQLEILATRERTLGKSHPEYAASVGKLSLIYQNKGDLDSSERLKLESLAIMETTIGKNNQLYINTQFNLANNYYLKGSFKKAEQLYLETIPKLEEKFGRKNTSVATALNSLAALYREMGEWDKSESIYLEVLNIRREILGLRHPYYILTLFNLGILYADKGDFEKAKKTYTECEENITNVDGINSMDIASIYNSQGNLYKQLGDYKKAENYYLKSIEIIQKKLGKTNAYCAGSLNNIGNLYLETKEYGKAEEYYLKALKIQEETIGKKHMDYALSLFSLANLYSKTDIYKGRSKTLYLEAGEIWESVLGKKHFNSIATKFSLALHEWRHTNVLEASNDFILSVKAFFDFFDNLSHRNSEKETLLLTAKYEYIFDNFLSYAKDFNTDSLSMTSFDYMLYSKHALLYKAISIRSAMSESDSLTKIIYTDWKSSQFQLNKWQEKPISERDLNLVERLEEKSQQLEKELVKRSFAFAEARRTITWQDVRSSLNPKEAAIEFIHFRYYTPEPTDSILYAALVLRPGDDNPHFVYLCTEAQLKTVLDRWNDKSVETSPAEVYWQHEGRPSLYKLLWQPLESLLPGGTAVWYAPTGLLHRLNFDAIAASATENLADRYALRRIGSTRQIVIKDPTLPTGKEAALFGGLRYVTDTLALQASLMKQGIALRAPDTEEKKPASPDGTRNLRENGIDYLEHSLTEVQNISKSLKTAGFNTQIFTDYTGTEEAFLQTGGRFLRDAPKRSPRILHVATHGYFFPDPKDTIRQRNLPALEQRIPYRASDNPFIRSGLLLSGSEHAWRTGTPASTLLADGILTAADIAAMDLSNTELAVLSACETGLGDVESNEGVYGLQRAFKIAGVRYLIMSLWKVDDEVTMKLMTAFYAKWLDKKSPMNIPDAFREAQKELRKDFPDPFFWAGFVLIE